jgi:tRNA(fMet)-specific endonuclease VapC
LKYLLDTSVCVTHLRSKSQSPLTAHLNSDNIEEVAICSIVRGELLPGAHHKRAPKNEVQRVMDLLGVFPSLPFDDAAADHFGRARAHLESIGGVIGANDLLIASIALAHSLTVVTYNRGEFTRIPGLRAETWTAEP